MCIFSFQIKKLVVSGVFILGYVGAFLPMIVFVGRWIEEFRQYGSIVVTDLEQLFASAILVTVSCIIIDNNEHWLLHYTVNVCTQNRQNKNRQYY